MKKIIIGIFAALFLVGATVSFAQSGWIGTSWITTGGSVSATNLKSNLDFLYNNKAPKPASDCTGNNQYLGWVNGAWNCIGEDAPQNCLFNGNTVSNGDQVTAYQSATVSYGQTCASESRSCTNGVLTGSFQESSCAVVPPTACSFGSQIVTHGDQVTVYEFPQVAYGETCQNETRTCQNGVFSGSYENQFCVVAPPTTCVFNGQTILNGEQATAYQSASVLFGQPCVTELRTCENGVLTGTYEHDNCTVQQQDPVTFTHGSFFELRTYEDVCYVDLEILGRIPLPYWEEKCTYSYYAFVGDNGVISSRQDGRSGNASNGWYDTLAANATTLTALCNLKGYTYLVGQSDISGFNSPGDNRLLYKIGQNWTTRGARYDNRRFGRNGSLTCSNNPRSNGVIQVDPFDRYLSEYMQIQ